MIARMGMEVIGGTGKPMKRDTLRGQDQVDAAALKERFSLEDE